MVDQGTYPATRARLLRDLAALPAGAPVRLGKTTSNLFRQRAGVSGRLDVTGLAGVLAVDPVSRTADVLGMTTYEDLVDATLAHGLVPLVVPQLKTITLGGAVTGVGIESSSFRNGTPHESVLEIEVLTGDGRIVTARPDNEHRDLFFSFPNSYGTLGYALRLVIELEPVRPYVALRHERFGSVDALTERLREVCGAREHDFVDGVWFGPQECYLTLGSYVDAPPGPVSDYTGMDIYYRSIQRRTADVLTTRDYLWRWDTDWFWCSRAFGVQRPAVRRLVPKRWLRSDSYWKVIAFEQKHRWKTRWDRRRGRPDREEVVQDVEVPVGRLVEFMDVFAREVPIEPVWLCPLQQRDPAVVWDLYAFDPGELYVNVGFWSSVPLAPGQDPSTHNRLVERLVADLGGRKSLYSTSFYTREEFAATYGGAVYDVRKKTYDPDSRLLDLYAKCVERR
ncbi:MAG TPA: FAD-binding oxidoreductase [Mycobacteriales bacterium]|jgi:FAD/FMN-containing dehydrogenase|nr:FAD-binding oxidoreductase [Mycobacteriales bacterium]